MDKQNLNNIILGDRSAFEWVYFRYYPSLLHTAYKKLADEQLAEEAVQDVFVNLWRKRGELDPEGNLDAYLFATLRNRVLHELRTQYNKYKHLGVWEEGMDAVGDSSLEEDLFARETAARLQVIIDSLPHQCKTAFLLSRQQQLSYKEIAEEMGISVNTVEKHIAKALRILREHQEKGLLSLALYAYFFTN